VSSLALVLVLSAAVAHAAWNVLAHGVSRSGMPFLWWGAVISTAPWAVAIPFTGGLGSDDLGGFALGVGVSGVLHVAYMLVLQQGYARGSLSVVYATARGTGPLLSGAAAVLLLGERPGPLALVGAVAIVAGVVAIGLVDRERPTAPDRRARLDPALVFGLLTGVAIAVYTIWDAHAIRAWSLSPVAYMVGCTLVEIPLYSLALGRSIRQLPATLREHWPRLLAFGVLSPLSYILVLTAITLAPVALVAPIREVSVVLVSLFGAFALKEGRAGWRVAASVVVVAGIAVLAR
jgi:drug/metabolite transporter (DMT)-like permease